MTFLDQLREAESLNQSMLCVGLDPEPSRFPAGITRDAEGINDFCLAIVEATEVGVGAVDGERACREIWCRRCDAARPVR